jgi:hypothetical protein
MAEGMAGNKAWNRPEMAPVAKLPGGAQPALSFRPGRMPARGARFAAGEDRDMPD